MTAIKNLIRFGKVSSINPAKATARVVFSDRDDLVSAELPILQGVGLKNKSFLLPDVGENVICLMTPSACDGSGFVLGSFFTDKVPPPAQNQDISMMKFEDGTTISYNRSSHELSINCVGTIKINGRRVEIN